MSRSLKFTQMIAGDLRDPLISQPLRSVLLISGRLETDLVIASVQFLIPAAFRKLKREPPVAICREPWMKEDPDWHNGPNLCWVLPEEWQDAMDWHGKSTHAILSEGRTWLLTGVRYLIDRHRIGHLNGLTEWPKEWPAWSHNQNGVLEYERRKRFTNWTREGT